MCMQNVVNDICSLSKRRFIHTMEKIVRMYIRLLLTLLHLLLVMYSHHTNISHAPLCIILWIQVLVWFMCNTAICTHNNCIVLYFSVLVQLSFYTCYNICSHSTYLEYVMPAKSRVNSSCIYWLYIHLMKM